ncbi:MAG: ATP-binding cassette domain-containing protein [Porticoccaceae bacterium]
MAAALSIRNLTKVYDNGFEALKGIDLDVQEGDFFALLGPNGAGKSTTIGIISSLVRKSEGNVEIFGTDVDADFSRAKRDIGVVPQNSILISLRRPLISSRTSGRLFWAQ